MAAVTLAGLIETVAGRFGIYKRLTATGGSTTTIVDTAGLLEVDSFWVGHWAYVLTDAGGASAAPEGEERPVTAYDQATNTLTVSPEFSAAVGAGDVVELLPEPRTRLTAAINEAIRAMGGAWPVVVEDDTSIEVAANDYDYDLPTDLVRLASVYRRKDTEEPWALVPGEMYWVAGTPGDLHLHFRRLTGLSDGDTLLLTYHARPSELSADTDTLGLGEPAEREAVAFIEKYALAVLHREAGSRDSGRFREHLTLATDYSREAEEMRRRAMPWGTPGRVKDARHTRAVRG